MQVILHLPGTASPTSELSSKARLPYACITGYATTPPQKLVVVRSGKTLMNEVYVKEVR